MRIIVTVLILVFSGQATAQLRTFGNRNLRDSLNVVSLQIEQSGSDSQRTKAADLFNSLMANLLDDTNSFYWPFDSLPGVAVHSAPDQRFKIYTWMIPYREGRPYDYYGYLQVKTSKNKIINYQLIDSSKTLNRPESRKLTPGNWFGAVYFNLSKVTYKRKNYYVMLGWCGIDKNKHAKIIDVISFGGDKPQFGLPVFRRNNVYRNRVFFYYTSQAAMALKFEQNKKLIVFDHLSASAGSLPGPDGSYDALRLEKGKWIMMEDVDVNNNYNPSKSPKKIYKDYELPKAPDIEK